MQVYLTNEQAQDIKLRTAQENKHEAEVIRDLLDKGRASSRRASYETTGDALLRLARLGEKLQVSAPADLSSRIDNHLYGDKWADRHHR